MEKLQIEEQFINNYKEAIKEIENIVKTSFIEYYGEEFKGKIENVFENLKIILIADNISQKTIDEKIKELENDNTKLMELGYYLNLNKKKKNEKNKKVILLYNERCEGHCEYDEWIEKYMEATGASIVNNESPIIYIRIKDNGTLELQGIIHEINHSIMKQALYVDEKSETHYIGGIYENDNEKMFNELINEYITKRILDKTIEKMNKKYEFIKHEFGSWYIGVDILNDSLIKEIFLKLEDLIKESIIKGIPAKIKHLLNDCPERIFDQINETYSRQLNEVYKPRSAGGRGVNIEIAEKAKEIDKIKLRERNEKVLKIVDMLYINYLKNEEEFKKNIDRLVEEGKARRVGQ